MEKTNLLMPPLSYLDFVLKILVQENICHISFKGLFWLISSCPFRYEYFLQAHLAFQKCLILLQKLCLDLFFQEEM